MAGATLADLEAAGPDALRRFLASLSTAEKARLRYHWPFWARPAQRAPEGDWTNWLIAAGRGFGKTRTGAEWVRERVEVHGNRRIALVAPTSADARDVMVEGPAGILAVSPPWNRPKYEPSNRRVVWPNGAIATLFSAEEPERLRGPQHEAAWCDELAAWKRCGDTWDMLSFGLRLGSSPQACITTTPRPVPTYKTILKDPATIVTRGSTYDNRANLASKFFSSIVSRYEGTRLGRQELNAELLEDLPGALWTMANIERDKLDRHPPLKRVVVAVDPAVTSGEDADDTGIVVAGIADHPDGREHAYVLADLTLHDTPEAWGRAAVAAYYRHDADRLVAEVNNGGDMVAAVIRGIDRNVSYRAVRASRGKSARAEPVAALYEQGRVHHVGSLPKLEDQLCGLMPGGEYLGDSKSPDRADALVWAITELMIKEGGRVQQRHATSR